MKFTISKATVATLNTQGAEVLELLNADATNTGACVFEFATRDGATKYANHSISLVDGEYILEINDEGVFKYMALYLKVARVIQPFIKPVMGMLSMLKSDIADIERFFSQQK